MLTGVAVHPRSSVLEQSAVEILIEGLKYLISQRPIGWLETLFPDAREFVSPVVHDSIEWCILRLSSTVVLELRFRALPVAARIERLFAWPQSFRRVETRYDINDENYLAFVQLAAIIICFRRF